jgi:hypothetical protein
MIKSDKGYAYIKKLLDESGIDFKNIDKNDILTTCENCPCEIDRNNYMLLLKAINDLYKSGYPGEKSLRENQLG